jgi:hypothetical protein
MAQKHLYIDTVDQQTKAGPDLIAYIEEKFRQAMRWAGTYQNDNREYFPNEVVYDEGWLMCCVNQTTDKPGPQTIGEEYYDYDGTFPTETIEAKEVKVGTRYTRSIGGYIRAIGIECIAGQDYEVYFVRTPDTDPIFEFIGKFHADVDGHHEWVVSRIVVKGAIFEVAVVISGPGELTNIQSAYWDYDTPNLDGDPGPGEIRHANRASDLLKVHKTDNDGVDRSAMLADYGAGDKIIGMGMKWSIESVVDEGGFVTFTVLPATQSSQSDGVNKFSFETVTPSQITYAHDHNYWYGNGEIQGRYIADGSYLDGVIDECAYGVLIKFQDAVISPDWEVMAHPER